MTETENCTPACPGCHIRCQIDKYQCARGTRFYAVWQAGEPLPERRTRRKRSKGDGADESAKSTCAGASTGAKPTADNAGAAKPEGTPSRPPAPPTKRVMHMLNIVSRAVRDRAETESGKLILDTIARHEGAAARGIIRARARLDNTAFDEAIGALTDAGLLEEREDENGKLFIALTETGLARADEWRSERMAADEQFLGALTDDEKMQLADLLSKLIWQ